MCNLCAALYSPLFLVSSSKSNSVWSEPSSTVVAWVSELRFFVDVPQGLGQLGKQLVNVARVLGRRLHERDPVLPSKLFSGFRQDFSVRAVALVPNEDPVDLFPGVSLYLLQPLREAAEAVQRADVVDKDDCVCTAVVALCDGSKPLLTSSIPDLELGRNIE